MKRIIYTENLDGVPRKTKKPKKDELFMVTYDWLEFFRTKNGGYTKAQFLALGIEEFPPKRGWKKNIVGTYILPEERKMFEKAREFFKGAKDRQECSYKSKTTYTWTKTKGGAVSNDPDIDEKFSQEFF